MITKQSIEQTGFAHIWSSYESDVRGVLLEHFRHFVHVAGGDLVEKISETCAVDTTVSIIERRGWGADRQIKFGDRVRVE